MQISIYWDPDMESCPRMGTLFHCAICGEWAGLQNSRSCGERLGSTEGLVYSWCTFVDIIHMTGCDAILVSPELTVMPQNLQYDQEQEWHASNIWISLSTQNIFFMVSTNSGNSSLSFNTLTKTSNSTFFFSNYPVARTSYLHIHIPSLSRKHCANLWKLLSITFSADVTFPTLLTLLAYLTLCKQLALCSSDYFGQYFNKDLLLACVY